MQLEVKNKHSTEEKMREKLMMAMLDSLYNNKLLDINVYKKVKAEIERS